MNIYNYTNDIYYIESIDFHGLAQNMKDRFNKLKWTKINNWVLGQIKRLSILASKKSNRIDSSVLSNLDKYLNNFSKKVENHDGNPSMLLTQLKLVANKFDKIISGV